MKRFQCNEHPQAELLSAGCATNGARLLICARCSNVIFVHKGVVEQVEGRKGTGRIVVHGPKGSREYLFVLGDVRDLRPARGQRVLFTSGITRTDADDYVPAATNLKPMRWKEKSDGPINYKR